MFLVYEAEYENGIYVGETGDFAERQATHFRKMKSEKTPFYCALRTNPSRFTWRIVLGARTAKDALHCETLIIAQYKAAGKRVLNCTEGGEMPPSHKGKKRSAETLAKMSAVRVGRSIHTPESRAKIAAAHQGAKRSEETKARMSASRRGRVVPPETRAKISASNRGKKRSPETCAKIAAAQVGRAPRTLSPENLEKLLAGQAAYHERRRNQENS